MIDSLGASRRNKISSLYFEFLFPQLYMLAENLKVFPAMNPEISLDLFSSLIIKVKLHPYKMLQYIAYKGFLFFKRVTLKCFNFKNLAFINHSLRINIKEMQIRLHWINNKYNGAYLDIKMLMNALNTSATIVKKKMQKSFEILVYLDL